MRISVDGSRIRNNKVAFSNLSGIVWTGPKTLTEGFHNHDRPVKDINDGKVITSERDQVERWAEHFRAVLNRQDPDTITEIPEALEDIDVRVDPPTQEEIRRAIETLKNGKAPGEDGICVEMCSDVKGRRT